ncbi:hypothetical protein PUR22_03630 [Mycolicibacterium porcinum]|uniref:DNA methyltransferase n=1 Tax=Mycolicibacterium porcinum TaxID=39693 RepID=UPI0031F892E0
MHLPIATDFQRFSARRVQARRHYTQNYADLQARYSRRYLSTSIRELVGPLPANESTHGLYPYPARLVRHIPRFFLNTEQIQTGIDYVVDPFCGSGTVLLEAQYAGTRAVGFDQNPVAALISRVKTTPVDIDAVDELFKSVILAAKRSRIRADSHSYLTKWYDPNSYSVLSRIGLTLRELPDESEADCIRVCFGLLSRRLSIMDRRIPVPVRDKRLVERELRTDDAWRTFLEIFSKTLERVSNLPPRLPKSLVFSADARNTMPWDALQKMGDGLVLTSPPYGAAQKYVRSTSLEAGWLGFASTKGTIDIERGSIGREHLAPHEQLIDIDRFVDQKLRRTLRKISKVDSRRAMIYSNYFSDMQTVVNNITSSRASIKRICLISGTNIVSQLPVDTRLHLNNMFLDAGFEKSLALKDDIRGRTLLTTRRGGASPAPAEYIDIFERTVARQEHR